MDFSESEEDQREVIEPEKIPESPVNAKSEKMISSPVDSQPQDAPEKSQQKIDSDKKEKKISPVRKLLSGIQSKEKENMGQNTSYPGCAVQSGSAR